MPVAAFSRRAAFLRTRIARRILLSFFVCALLPVVLLAVVAHHQVTEQLQSQSESRQRESSKAAGMAVLQRLNLLSDELAIDGRRLMEDGAGDGGPSENEHFSWVRAAALDDAALRAVMEADSLRTRLLSGEPMVWTVPGEPVPLRMARNVGTPDAPDLLLAEPSARFVAGFSPVPAAEGGYGLCLLDSGGAPIVCPHGASAVTEMLSARGRAGRAAFEWSAGGDRYIAAAWPIFLGPGFGAPSWMMVASEDRATAFAAVRDFERLMGLAFMLALVVVLLLGHVQIRRSLEPVERLQDGTRKIADRDFASRVEISSGDEFEQLGDSFNEMAASLSLQWRALAARGELDRAVLSALDAEAIVGTVLCRGMEVVPCDGLAVIMLPANDRNVAAFSTSVNGAAERQSWLIGDSELHRLGPGTDLIRLSTAQQPEGLVPRALRDGRPAAWTLAPMRTDGRLGGWLAFRHSPDQELGYDERGLARGLADQVAVALSNARLVDELDALRWGALHALARAIDAKSPWTAGHSERVTEYALRIGRGLQLADDEMDLLRRGGLLHDVGKIGVPAEVLDKPGKLTDEEWKLMRDHPTIGARILEPIAQYRDVLPMVLYHHEKYDGTGYPEGRAAEDIPYFARILAVADVYDALTSDRPYRSGMPHSVALGIIRKDAGPHFDPFLAELFVQIMEHADGPAQAGESVNREVA
jgi:putative nucleotidyltransferase with HDIG domain